MIEYDLEAYNRKWKGAVAPLQVYLPNRGEPSGIIYSYITKVDYVDDKGVCLFDRKGVPLPVWKGKPEAFSTYDPLYIHIPPRIYESNVGPVALVRRNIKSFKLGVSQETHYIHIIMAEGKEFRWESLVLDKKVSPTGDKTAHKGVIDDRCWWSKGNVYNLSTNIGLMNADGEVFLSHKELIPYYQRKWGKSWTILPQ